MVIFHFQKMCHNNSLSAPALDGQSATSFLLKFQRSMLGFTISQIYVWIWGSLFIHSKFFLKKLFYVNSLIEETFYQFFLLLSSLTQSTCSVVQR